MLLANKIMVWCKQDDIGFNGGGHTKRRKKKKCQHVEASIRSLSDDCHKGRDLSSSGCKRKSSTNGATTSIGIGGTLHHHDAKSNRFLEKKTNNGAILCLKHSTLILLLLFYVVFNPKQIVSATQQSEDASGGISIKQQHDELIRTTPDYANAPPMDENSSNYVKKSSSGNLEQQASQYPQPKLVVNLVKGRLKLELPILGSQRQENSSSGLQDDQEKTTSIRQSNSIFEVQKEQTIDTRHRFTFTVNGKELALEPPRPVDESKNGRGQPVDDFDKANGTTRSVNHAVGPDLGLRSDLDGGNKLAQLHVNGEKSGQSSHSPLTTASNNNLLRSKSVNVRPDHTDKLDKARWQKANRLGDFSSTSASFINTPSGQNYHDSTTPHTNQQDRVVVVGTGEVKRSRSLGGGTNSGSSNNKNKDQDSRKASSANNNNNFPWQGQSTPVMRATGPRPGEWSDENAGDSYSEIYALSSGLQQLASLDNESKSSTTQATPNDQQPTTQPIIKLWVQQGPSTKSRPSNNDNGLDNASFSTTKAPATRNLSSDSLTSITGGLNVSSATPTTRTTTTSSGRGHNQPAKGFNQAKSGTSRSVLMLLNASDGDNYMQKKRLWAEMERKQLSNAAHDDRQRLVVAGDNNNVSGFHSNLAIFKHQKANGGANSTSKSATFNQTIEAQKIYSNSKVDDYKSSKGTANNNSEGDHAKPVIGQRQVANGGISRYASAIVLGPKLSSQQGLPEIINGHTKPSAKYAAAMQAPTGTHHPDEHNPNEKTWNNLMMQQQLVGHKGQQGGIATDRLSQSISTGKVANGLIDKSRRLARWLDGKEHGQKSNQLSMDEQEALKSSVTSQLLKQQSVSGEEIGSGSKRESIPSKWTATTTLSSVNELPGSIYEYKSNFSTGTPASIWADLDYERKKMPMHERRLNESASQTLNGMDKAKVASNDSSSGKRIVQRDLGYKSVDHNNYHQRSILPLHAFKQHQSIPGKQDHLEGRMINQVDRSQRLSTYTLNSGNPFAFNSQPILTHPKSSILTRVGGQDKVSIRLDSEPTTYLGADGQIRSIHSASKYLSAAQLQQLVSIVPAAMVLLARASQNNYVDGSNNAPSATSNLNPPIAHLNLQHYNQLPTMNQQQLRFLALASQQLMLQRQQQQSREQQQHPISQQMSTESSSDPASGDHSFIQQQQQQQQQQQHLKSPASQTNLTDQLLASSNQLGVAHLGPSASTTNSVVASAATVAPTMVSAPSGAPSASESSSYNSLANYQDYSDYRPMDSSQTANGGSTNISGSQQQHQHHQHHQQQQQQQSTTDDGGQGQSRLSSSQTSSLYGLSDFSPNQQQATNSELSAYYELSAPRANLMSGNPQSHHLNGEQPSSRSSLADMYLRSDSNAGPRAALGSDPYEEYSNSASSNGGGLSTSEYERDLADLDDEFSRHVGFSRRPVSGDDTPLGADRYEPQPANGGGRYTRRPGASLMGGAGYGSLGDYLPADYLNTAGSITNMIPRSASYHQLAGRVSSVPTWPISSVGQTAADPTADLWTESAYDYNPALANYLGQTYVATGTRWRPRYRPQHPISLTTAASYPHQQRIFAASPAASYYGLSPLSSSPSSIYQHHQLGTEPSGSAAYNLYQSYGPTTIGASGGVVPSPATETVSFTLSPLAAAAAAAATALAAVDKGRQQHHQHGSWTFTLPRLASSLAAASSLVPASSPSGSATSTASAGGSGAGTSLATSGGSSAAASSPQPATTVASYAYPRAPYYLTGSMPIYAAIGPPPPRVATTGAGLTGSASGVTASVLPYHQFHSLATPTIFAYHRPTGAMLHPHNQSPLLAATSFGYPYHRLATGANYAPIHPAAHYIAAAAAAAAAASTRPIMFGSPGSGPLMLAASSPSSTNSGRTTTTLSPSSSSSQQATAKPSYLIDLQLVETKSKPSNPSPTSDSSKSSTSSKSHSLTAIARNLTKKMFGSASQIRPQHVAPPLHMALEMLASQNGGQSSVSNAPLLTPSIANGGHNMQQQPYPSSQPMQVATNGGGVIPNAS